MRDFSPPLGKSRTPKGISKPSRGFLVCIFCIVCSSLVHPGKTAMVVSLFYHYFFLSIKIENILYRGSDSQAIHQTRAHASYEYHYKTYLYLVKCTGFLAEK